MNIKTICNSAHFSRINKDICYTINIKANKKYNIYSGGAENESENCDQWVWKNWKNGFP